MLGAPVPGAVGLVFMATLHSWGTEVLAPAIVC